MRFSCLQENLSRGISTVGHLALKASSLPVLHNVYVQAKNGGLQLSATNLEAGIHHVVRGKISEDGECLVPARLLLDLIPLLPGGPLHGDLTSEGLVITTENGVTTLRVHPTADFPIIPSVEEKGVGFTLSRGVLVAALNRVVGAAGKIENRPQFNGVYIWLNHSEVAFAATDGFRLAEVRLKVKKGSGEAKVILPLVAAQEIARIMSLADDEEDVVVSFGDNQIKTSTSTTGLVSRLIEGEYPDYVALFPTEATTKGVVDVMAVARALKATTLFSRAGLPGVTLDIDPGEKRLSVSSESGDVGAHKTALPLEGQGEAVRVIANARYILDGISGVPGRVLLSLTNGERPLLITPEKADYLPYRYLVMPIRQ